MCMSIIPVLSELILVAKDCSSVHIEAADDLRELIKANSRLLDMLYKTYRAFRK